MKKETLFIAISNQKGGVGKSAITTLMASYLYMLKDKNVAIIDCDYPQYSIFNMRQDDRKTVGLNPELQVALARQFDVYQKKAYPIIKVNPENALLEADRIIENSSSHMDIIFFDLPGTVNNAGIINLILNMDHIFVPIVADKRVLQSSLAFALIVKSYLESFGNKVNLKDIHMFWNKVDKREHRELYDDFNEIIEQQNIRLLNTELPDTKKYNKELSPTRNAIFRSTLFPPDAKLLRNSRLDILIQEISEIVKL